MSPKNIPKAHWKIDQKHDPIGKNPKLVPQIDLKVWGPGAAVETIWEEPVGGG